MWQALRRSMIRRMQQPFRRNPLIERPGEYLPPVGQAVGIGLLGALILMLMGFIGSVVFVVGVIRGWF